MSGLYKRYQFAPVFALAARSQYFSDRGGLFSRALKEQTLVAGFKLAEGFLTRLEWRRDFSNRPFFLTGQLGRQSVCSGGLTENRVLGDLSAESQSGFVRLRDFLPPVTLVHDRLSNACL